MIQHILKIIWTERKINMWILLELILVFCILWFCVDYVSYMIKQYLEPKGFDIEHTYTVNIGLRDEGNQIFNSEDSIKKQELITDFWEVFDRVKRYPLVESAAISSSSVPYSGGYRSSRFKIGTDSVVDYSRFKIVTPEFFDVFKINLINNKLFDWSSIVGEKQAVLSAGNDGLIFKKNPENIQAIGYEKPDEIKIVGTVERTKCNEYDTYESVVYKPFDRNDPYVAVYREFSIRVKPDADHDFADKFIKDMRNQLQIGHYYLISVESFSKLREGYIRWRGYENNFRSISAITLFLLVNIFLGVIGTFWFRIQSRRSEIGLRISVGASKNNVVQMFISETFLLVFMASLVGTILCVNITMADLLSNIDIPVVNRGQETTKLIEYATNYCLTFLVLFAIALMAVWYPAHKASAIQPAEALRDE